MKSVSSFDAVEEIWLNQDRYGSESASVSNNHRQGVVDAKERFRRFQPTLKVLFPELEATGGVIESPLLDGSPLFGALNFDRRFGSLLVKADHLLPVAGSIKARGGVHAVLGYAEEVAEKEGLLDGDDYSLLATPEAKKVFAKYTLSVGSTGNLGLSVGTMGAAFGFNTVVHMSAEAKGWKKERLLQLGVKVVQHAGDYEQALGAGRAECAGNPFAFFIDDEDSLPLLYGYATAIERLNKQLEVQNFVVDADHPLFVYVPCGVGGAPAGIALGLHLQFGDRAHCFFAEPVEAPCVLLAMKSGSDGNFPSIYDAGLSGNTEADGLSVPRASRCAVDVARPLISGVFTVTDKTMFRQMFYVHRDLNNRIEPSASAGFAGPASIGHRVEFKDYIIRNGLQGCMQSAVHVMWSTGGKFIPDALFQHMISGAAEA